MRFRYLAIFVFLACFVFGSAFAESPQLTDVGWVVDVTRPECGPYPGLSMRGAAFIMAQESFSSVPYKDTIGWAVGYGFHTWNGRKVTAEYPGYVTKDEADAQFWQQIWTYEDVVRDAVCVPLSQHAFDALVSVAYNTGRVNRTIARKLQKNKPVTEADFVSTATTHQKVNPRLIPRRQAEYAMFMGLD